MFINLIQLLNHYCPTSPEEIQFKKLMLSFIDAHADCFERSLEIGHITASAWLLNNDMNHVLLMHHAKLHTWVQLGGHCDGNPDVLAVALKEAQEESGIEHIVPVNCSIFDIDIHRIPARAHEKEHDHYDVRFLLKVASDEQPQQNSESNELRWIDKNAHNLPTDNPSIRRMFNKWVAL